MFDPNAHETWFHLGVVAPAGREPPGGPARVLSRLLSLVRHRERRRERIGITAVCGEPVTRDALDLFRGRGWHPSFIIRHPDRRRDVAHRAACAQVAVQVDALVLFHSGRLDRDMEAVLWWCDWLGVTWRTVRLEAEPAPV